MKPTVPWPPGREFSNKSSLIFELVFRALLLLATLGILTNLEGVRD